VPRNAADGTLDFFERPEPVCLSDPAVERDPDRATWNSPALAAAFSFARMIERPLLVGQDAQIEASKSVSENVYCML
jgi:hypothetical protein